jgi:hypothetical protein
VYYYASGFDIVGGVENGPEQEVQASAGGLHWDIQDAAGEEVALPRQAGAGQLDDTPDIEPHSGELLKAGRQGRQQVVRLAREPRFTEGVVIEFSEIDLLRLGRPVTGRNADGTG